MVEPKILNDVLKESYDNTYKQLIEIKEKLPAEYKSFIDVHLKSLKKVNSDLQKDIDYYSFKSGNQDDIIKSFKIHCADRFFNILAVSQPENILKISKTYAAEYMKNKTTRH